MIAGFDPHGNDFGRNPWPVYQALRARTGLPFWPEFGGYLASRYEDVQAIATDRRMVRSAEAFSTPDECRRLQIEANFHDMPFHERFVQHSMLDIDGPDHDRLRRAVFPFFTKTRLSSLRDWVSGHVAATLDRVVPMGQLDFIAYLAAELPGQVIGRLIGTDPDRAPQMTRWSDDVVSYFDIDRTDAKKQRAEDATRKFHGLLESLCADRKAVPRDDLATAMIRAQEDGLLTRDEMISTLMQLLHAGHGSTIDALGNGLHALMHHPDQMELLRGNPTLMPVAVQEMFRFAAPLPFFHRYASEDLTICGQDWPKGTKFGLLYAAANRDPAAFGDADRLDISRKPNLHLAFGAGPHVCLGNNLARLTIDILFQQLLDRTSRIDAAGPARWKTGLQAHGPVSLPVIVRPRTH